MTERVEVTVTSPGYWADKPQQLSALLSGSPPSVITDPTGAPADPAMLTVLVDPAGWAAEQSSLAAAMRAAALGETAIDAGGADGGVGAVADSGDRLVYTVEEAAHLLGISRAFAYEAVQRGEIPSMRIGRRILVPKNALQRLLDSAGG